MRERIVLAYTGDVRTSVAIEWLAKHHRAEVVAVTLDLGQRAELEEVRHRALASGAVRAHVLDVRDELARDYILPCLQAGVLCRDGYPMASPITRPLISKTLVEIARIENAVAIAHGSTRDLANGPAIETLVRDLDAHLPVLAPAHEWRMTPGELVEYARRHGVPISLGARDRDCLNLWGHSVLVEGASDGCGDPPEKLYALTSPVAAVLKSPASLVLGFERGIPVTINGVPMPLTELIESLTLIAGHHGVGRLEWTTHRQDGTASQEISEAPAAQVLHLAHADLEASVMPSDLLETQRELCRIYADLLRSGRWFTPLREALDAFYANAQSRVTGMSHLRLFNGQAGVVAPEMVSYA